MDRQTQIKSNNYKKNGQPNGQAMDRHLDNNKIEYIIEENRKKIKKEKIFNEFEELWNKLQEISKKFHEKQLEMDVTYKSRVKQKIEKLAKKYKFSRIEKALLNYYRDMYLKNKYAKSVNNILGEFIKNPELIKELENLQFDNNKQENSKLSKYDIAGLSALG